MLTFPALDEQRVVRFCLHTATVDFYVSDGDAKLWGDARNLQDDELYSGSRPTCSRRSGWIFGEAFS